MNLVRPFKRRDSLAISIAILKAAKRGMRKTGSRIFITDAQLSSLLGLILCTSQVSLFFVAAKLRLRCSPRRTLALLSFHWAADCVYVALSFRFEISSKAHSDAL
jgi:hypothetical protein